MRKTLQCALVIFLAGTLIPAVNGMASAVEGNAETSDAQRTPRSDSDGADGWTLLWSPPDELYRRPIADPHRSGFAFTYGQFMDSEIKQAGDSRLLIRMGGGVTACSGSMPRDRRTGDTSSTSGRTFSVSSTSIIP